MERLKVEYSVGTLIQNGRGNGPTKPGNRLDSNILFNTVLTPASRIKWTKDEGALVLVELLQSRSYFFDLGNMV